MLKDPTTEKYKQLASYLREQIRGGALQPGSRLLSFTEACSRYSCTQSTIERAHALLEREGLIERRHRRGTYVASPLPVSHLSATGLLTQAIFIITEGLKMHIDQPQSGWEEHVTNGALEAVHAAGMHAVALHPSRLTPQGVQQLIEGNAVGVVMTHFDVEVPFFSEVAAKLRNAGIPVVIYGNAPEFQAYDRVVSDHEVGAYNLTTWLLGKGCRQIGMVWHENHPGRQAYWRLARRAGYEKAMRQAGLAPLSPILIRPHREPVMPRGSREYFEQDIQRYREALGPVIDGPPDCDALMVDSDGFTFAAGAACRSLGREPGEDVLIAGYDNYWAGSFERSFESSAPVATVDKHNRQLGAETAHLLLERIAGEASTEPECRMVSPQTVIVNEAFQLVATAA